MISAVLLASVVAAYGPNVPYSQTFEDNYNTLKFTGNAGPYSDRRGLGIARDPPEGCAVDSVWLYMRHGERYPSASATKSQVKSLDKVLAKKQDLSGPLEFAKTWVPYAWNGNPWLETESTVGPYSGLHSGYLAGLYYTERYGHLWNPEVITPLFASGSERIVDTARRFIEGFFGYNTSSAALNIIPENAGQGANTLVPVCSNTSIGESPCTTASKRDYKPFRDIAAKWNKDYGLQLEWSDIPNLCEMAAYELNVRGRSPWVAAFPSDVWVAYEHYLSAGFWCETGPGSPEALARGNNLLNASRTLLLQGSDGLPLSLNFAHDTDIAPFQAALGLDPAPLFNDSKIQTDSGYRLSDIIPQGGRVILERLACKADSNSTLSEKYPLGFNNSLTYKDANVSYAKNATVGGNGVDYYVRVVVNEAVAPLDECMSGPGLSCPLQEYSDYVDKRIAGKEFSQVCNLTEGAPKYLDFYWNYNTTQDLNTINKTIAYQAYQLNWLGQAI